ncbi:MAG: hypothetical protein KBB39_07130 [Phycicoccus sp.]|nr:hypothetical protein [Phycicoccus sp.]
MGIFDRFRRDLPSTPQPGPEGEVTQDDIDEAAREAVIPAFLTREEAIEQVGEYLDLPEDDPRPAAAVDAVIEVRRAQVRAMTGPGTYHRVQRAFDVLAEQGVVARMNFTCCQTCGHAEIGDERADPQAQRDWGYTFFHQQDATRLATAGEDLFLSYGIFAPAPDLDPQLRARADAGDVSAQEEATELSRVLAGRAVAQALRSQGLDVDWDDDTSRRIQVAVGVWDKPLP